MVKVRIRINQGQNFSPICDQRQENPNPYSRNTSQIFAPLFDQNQIFIDTQQEKPNLNIKNMDQSSNKPSLSKARLVKPRKKLSNRKPPSLPKLENIAEKINRWNPFVVEAGVRVSESSGANSDSGACCFGGTNLDTGKFVFGSVGPNLSQNSSCRSAGSYDSSKSERFQFEFGSGVEKNDGSSRESSLGSDEGLVFSNLPDELRKMDLKSTGSGDDFEKERQVENGFIFGGSRVNVDNSDARNVVFGGDVKKSIDLSRNSGIGSYEGLFSKLPDEMGKLNLWNSGNINDFEKKKQAENGFVFAGSMNLPGSASSVSGSQSINVGWEKLKTHSVSFDSEGCGNSDKGVFTFGTGMNKSADASGLEKGSFSNLPEETRKLNLKNSGNVDDFKKNKLAENNFVFGGSKTGSKSTNSVSGSHPINVGLEKPNTHSVSVGSEGSENSDEGVFIFGNSMEKRADASGLEKGTLSNLPEELRKLNLKNSIKVDEFEKNKQAANVFAFGGSKTGSVSSSQPINVGSEKPNTHSSSFGSEGCGNSDEGVFIFGKLPDEMKRLNLKNFDNVDEFEKNNQAQNVFGGSNTGPGSSSGTNEYKIPVSAEFVSFHGAAPGSKPINMGLKKPSVASSSFSSEGSGNSYAGTFVFGSGGKRSVNLSRSSSLGLDENLFFKLPDETRKMNLTCENGFEKLKTADNGIKSGGDRDVTGSFPSGIERKVPEEHGKVNAGWEGATQSMKSETVGSATGPFLFGSSAEKCSVSGFDNDTTFNFPTSKKFSTKGHEKDREMGHREKVDAGNSFIFGTSENASAFPGQSIGNSTLHDDMEKLKIGTNTEKFAGNVPFECAFQGGKQDDRSNMTSIPSSPAPKFQSAGPTFSFTGKPAGLEPPHMEFKTPKQYAAPLTKETLFTGTYQNLQFGAKKSGARKTRTNKKKGKPGPLYPLYQNFAAQFASEGSDPLANPEVDSTEGYSPMDYSPYHEELVADQHSREPSVASEDSIHFFSHGASTDTQKSVSGYEQEEVLVSEAERLNLSEGTRQVEVGDYGSEDLVKRNFVAESVSLDEQTDKFENSMDTPKHENVDLDNDARTHVDAEAGFFSFNLESPAREGGTEFTSSSSLGDLGESNFKFSASYSVRGPLPAAKHTSRRKNMLKSGQNPSFSTANGRVSLTSPLPDLIPQISTSGLLDLLGQNNTLSAPRSEDERKTGKSKESNARKEPTSSAADSVPVKETCEKWRLRGNQAYANGHLTKAEDYYTRGVNSVSLKEIPCSCIKPLSLCYSNRAATRMSLGKWREALHDCKMAVSLNPDFLKARVRVANCHLALGEIGEALNHFKKCLQSEKDISSNQKYIIEASVGLQKAQQVADLTGQSADLLLRRTSNDASKALNMITEALAVSPNSESLLEMKAEALLLMRNYEDVIKLCEQTLDLTEQNSVVMESDSQFENAHPSEFMESLSPRLWRWRLMAKSYFYLGKLEEALELFQKHEKAEPPVDKTSGASTSFAVMVHELLQFKTAGNEAFQAGRHSEAVEYYSSALAYNSESRPFAAVCFCNRAAAYQALVQITDSIADCSLAIALDPSYAKAISRRATLHELIRDYGQAANDLNRLISLLQKQMQGKDNLSRGIARSSSNVSDLKRARARLASVEEEARKGLSLNMYMILGIEPSSSSADVKKAYRKAALRHHPDKAAQFLVRNENVDDELWREMAAEVHADADRLFKMIGEAYTTLSDPTKRLEYDEEEEMRTCPGRGYNASSPRTPSHYAYSGYHEKSFDRHPWRSRGSSNHRW